MNVKKGDVNFRVNHIIVIGKVDIIIDSGIINIVIIVKSSIFSIILTANVLFFLFFCFTLLLRALIALFFFLSCVVSVCVDSAFTWSLFVILNLNLTF